MQNIQIWSKLMLTEHVALQVFIFGNYLTALECGEVTAYCS